MKTGALLFDYLISAMSSKKGLGRGWCPGTGRRVFDRRIPMDGASQNHLDSREELLSERK